MHMFYLFIYLVIFKLKCHKSILVKQRIALVSYTGLFSAIYHLFHLNPTAFLQ